MSTLPLPQTQILISVASPSDAETAIALQIRSVAQKMDIKLSPGQAHLRFVYYIGPVNVCQETVKPSEHQAFDFPGAL